MMGYHSYMSKESPSGVWQVANDTFDIGLDEFSCNWNTKYVEENYEESMSTCANSNRRRDCTHHEDIVITCFVNKGI